ncbi:MAG: glycosyltransferase family 4 protein [Chloroflexota bacterium]
MTRRIALLHYTAPPVVGGVEAVLGAHARLFADAGHDVRIIVGRGRSTDSRVELVRIPLIDSRNARVVGLRRELAAGRAPPEFGRLAGELARDLSGAIRGVDLLIIHNVGSLHFNLPLTAALHEIATSPGAPVMVAWTHDVAAAMPSYVGDLHRGWPWDLIRSSWPGVTWVAVSETRRRDLARVSGLAPGAIRVIPNGIDIADNLRLHPATRRLVDDHDLRGVGPVLFTPSRMTPRKNLELALHVIAELRVAAPGARLVITGALDPHDLGSRAYRERLRDLAESLAVTASTTILSDHERGRVAAAVVRDLYRIADVLFLPSHDEGFGLTILEAAIARLPIVCADIPALREVAPTGATFFDLGASSLEVARLVEERLAADAMHRLAVRTRTQLSWPAVYATWIKPLVSDLLDMQG